MISTGTCLPEAPGTFESVCKRIANGDLRIKTGVATYSIEVGDGLINC